MYLAEFEIIRPHLESTQEELLKWLEILHQKKGAPADFKRWILKFCCKEENISKRGHCIDFETLEKRILPNGFQSRSEYFIAYGEKIFDQFYADQDSPNDIVHVTCTGYSAPSIAQKLIAKKRWGRQTQVTHLYHMGCMAALPAIRIGCSYSSKRVDIVHTEMCTLHMNGSLHEPEQLVAQSLFGDGFIKYSIFKEKPTLGYRVVTQSEELIDETTDHMKWECQDWGLKMTLAKEIPEVIEREIAGFVERLLTKAKCTKEETLFAIHPGGPKIVEKISQSLMLNDMQTEDSRAILHQYGNMSSATLPHIFEKILTKKAGTKVLGVAFGPGLIMSGIVLERV